MRRVIAGMCLGVLICFPGISLASGSAERAGSYFMNEQQLPEIETLGIAPSDDPWVLFEAFAKRFSVVRPEEFHRGSRDIRRIY